MKVLILALLPLAVGSASPSLSANDSDPLDIVSSVTWASPAQPEVHVLLRNQTDRTLPFSLWIGELPGPEGMKCHGSISAEKPDLFTRFSPWLGVSLGRSGGIVPPDGWAHRSFLVGDAGGVAPCSVPYLAVVGAGEERKEVRGNIDVPEPTGVPRGMVSSSSLNWEAMFEKDEIHRNRVIARVLVTNRESHSIDVFVHNRWISCAEGGRLSWALFHGVLQGEDVGPFSLSGKGWAAFVMALEVQPGTEPERCSLGLELFGDTNEGSALIARFEVPVEITGTFTSPQRRTKE